MLPDDGRYLSQQQVASTVFDDSILERSRASSLNNLSPREHQILQRVGEGKSIAEATAMLFLWPKPTDAYRSRMMQKLGIGDPASLAKFAIQHRVNNSAERGRTAATLADRGKPRLPGSLRLRCDASCRPAGLSGNPDRNCHVSPTARPEPSGESALDAGGQRLPKSVAHPPLRVRTRVRRTA